MSDDTPTPREGLTAQWSVGAARAVDISQRADALAESHGRGLRPHEAALYRRIAGDAQWYRRAFERWIAGGVPNAQKDREFRGFNRFAEWANGEILR